MSKKRRVLFVFARFQSGFGSKKMRVDQLNRIAGKHLSDKYDFQVMAIKKSEDRFKQLVEQAQDAIVIFLKNAFMIVPQDYADQVKNAAAALCIDCVDVGPNGQYCDYYDCLIAASRKSESAINAFVKDNKDMFTKEVKVAHLTHGPDDRLEAINAPKANRFQIAYLGLPTSSMMPEEITAQIKLLDYDPNNALAGLKVLAHYPMQYGVRAGRRRRGTFLINPFTKGFNAAVLGQNILINRQAADAVHYLGDNYPYLIADNGPQTIQAGLDRAREGFGSREWAEALARMQYVKDVSSGPAIAKELDGILEAL